MKQRTFKRIETLMGIGVFLIATIVYILTMEKSASLWDCPEFIVTFNKLEVGHPPGAPFYMLFYNVFSSLFPSGTEYIAIAANALSSILSGLTIFLLFLSISHLVRRTLLRGSAWHAPTIDKRTSYLALGAGLVGSLLFAFTDTFWYSAVEAEVYSFSSLFTALVFFLMLKWEAVADESTSDRWIIAIAYLMGLSVGVHLLNLLCIPAMALIYYYRKFDDTNWKGAVKTLLLSFVLIAVVLFGIIQGMPEIAGWFDLFAVNILGLSFNTGFIIYLILLSALLVVTYLETIRIETRKKTIQILFLIDVIFIGIPFMGDSWIVPIIIIILTAWWVFTRDTFTTRLANLMTLCMAVFFVGFSTYGVIIIRANSDIPMNQNTPSDVFSLRKYLARDQYGSTPLIYGKTYASLPERNSDGTVVTKEKVSWVREEKTSPDQKDKYLKQIVEDVVYRSDMNMLFPRVYNSTQEHYPYGYQMWGDITGHTKTIYENGQPRTVTVPTFAENLKYFFNYQINFMYWRYFLWNFSGRQNDLQGNGELTRGNWCTGIPFIDKLLIGPQGDDRPALLKDNPGHNTYYMLPLLLGILGIAFQLSRRKRGKETFFITLMFFFMTGLAIVLYLNQPPFQVRERDYAYAGSFYAFAIWIGFGVAFLADLMERLFFKKRSPLAAIIATIVCLGVPALVLAENYDDHNRHGRRLASDFGSNYLESCEPNGIIFCNGDNDTFPLWYAQEVEGIRKDLRVCNTSYLQADWYIDAMRKDAYNSKALPLSITRPQYGGDNLSIVYLLPILKEPVEIDKGIEFATSDDPRLKRLPDVAQEIDYIPTTTLTLTYDPKKLIEQGSIYPSDTAYITDNKMVFDFSSKRILTKNETAILDLLKQNNFERPIYYCITVSETEYVGTQPYFRQTGVANQVMPFRTDSATAKIDVERMYNNVMNKFRFGGADNPNVYIDQNGRRMCETYRPEVFGKLAYALLSQGDVSRAQEVLKKGLVSISPEAVPYTKESLPFVDVLFRAGMTDEAMEIVKDMTDEAFKMLDWISKLKPTHIMGCGRDIDEALTVVTYVSRLTNKYDEKYYNEIKDKALYYLQMYGKIQGE